MPNNAAILIRAVDDTKGAFGSVKRSLGDLGEQVRGLGGLLAGAFALSDMFSTINQFEKLSGQLKTVTGSAALAGDAFEGLQAFAAQTPFTLDQAVTAFTRLVSLGLNPSEAALTSYGNTASAMGKDLLQMVEAVADAATGEFERLKEFGIKASAQGDQVKFTFQGVTTSVGNNAREIEQYLINLGNTKFANAMADQMDTLPGLVSNLRDEFDGLWRSVGDEGATTILKDGVRALIDILGQLKATLAFVAGEFRQGSDGANVFGAALDGVRFLASRLMIGLSSLASLLKTVGQGLGAFAAAVYEAMHGNFLNAGRIFKSFVGDAKSNVNALGQQIDRLNRQDYGKKGSTAKLNQVASQVYRPAAPTKAGATKATKTPAAILNDAKQTLDAHLALTKDSLDRESRLIEQQLADHLLSYRAYYAKKQALEQGAIDAELAAKRAERAGAKDKGDVARLTAEITILERKRGDVAVQSRRDQIQAEEALAQQLAGIRQQLLSDQGDVAGAAVEQIQAKYAELWDRLSAEGDSQGQALIQKAINVELAKSQLDALQQQYTLTMQRMQDADQRIQIARDTGLLSETQARQQMLDLHRATASELDQIIPKMEALATASGNPQAVANVAALKTELLGLKTVANETGQAIESAVSGGMTNLFTDIMSGSKSAKDAFMDFANGVIQAIQRIVAQKLAEKLLDSTGGGGWASAIGSVISGARATGGPVSAGKTYLVGERGPELFSAGVSGYITPNNKLGGSQTIVNNFSVQGPTTRQTETQIAAAAGAGVSRALRRNG